MWHISGGGCVSDTHTQYRHLDPLNLMIFEKKKEEAHTSQKRRTSNLLHGWKIENSSFSLIPLISNKILNNLQHIMWENYTTCNTNKCRGCVPVPIPNFGQLNPVYWDLSLER